MPEEVETSLTIWNRTTDADGRKYIVYFAKPDQPVHPSFPTVQPIFYSTGSLARGQSSEFSITSELFGVLCYCEGYPSTEMRDGRSVGVRDSRSVTLGADNEDGTSLFVRNGDKHVAFDDDALLGNAPAGTFRIRCDAKLEENNHYAVGIGRKIGNDNDRIWPIILVRCVPSITFTFRPIQRFYVGYAPLTRFNRLTIVDPPKATRAEADFDGSGTAIKIYDDNSGNFWVNDKLCAAYGTADKSIPKQNASRPTPGRSAGQPSNPSPPHPSGPQNNPSSSTAPRENQNPPGPVPYHVKRFPEYLPKPADEDDEDEDGDIGDNGFDITRLDEWDVVFVVDDTGTMKLSAEGSPTKLPPKDFTGKTRWKLVCEALEYLADVTAQQNNDGIDVYFLLNKNLNKRKVKDGQSVLNQLQRVDLKKKGGTLFEPTLTPILHEYLEKLRKAPNSEDVRPLNIIVLTDGDAQDKKATNKLIRKTESKLDLLEVRENQLGIQFVQVGEDKVAAAWLKNVYNDHKDKDTRNVRTSSYSEYLPFPPIFRLPLCICCPY
jgi:hypothetical protein